jgi:hypothetical protein
VSFGLLNNPPPFLSPSFLPILSLSFYRDHRIHPPTISTWVFLSTLSYIFYLVTSFLA